MLGGCSVQITCAQTRSHRVVPPIIQGRLKVARAFCTTAASEVDLFLPADLRGGQRDYLTNLFTLKNDFSITRLQNSMPGLLTSITCQTLDFLANRRDANVCALHSLRARHAHKISLLIDPTYLIRQGSYCQD